MLFHLKEKDFKKFVGDMSKKVNISSDIIEKDYYVCAILKELAENQNYLKAYFKGGTAVYKILDTMNRFSEDIDLTVEVIKEESNNSNKTRLKKAALGYKIEGLELEKDRTKDVKQSVTAYYKYNSLFKEEKNPLHKAGGIQVEATSFTVSEPIEQYYIEPLIYKLANENEKKILEEQFEISKIKIEIIKLERMFIDKIFAAEFYYIRNMYMDTAKHLYDISVLFNNDKIQKLLNNEEELSKLIEYKRQEEKVRIGGIDENSKIKDFDYFKLEFSEGLIKTFENMQNKYVLNDKYKFSIDEVKDILKKIYNKICDNW